MSLQSRLSDFITAVGADIKRMVTLDTAQTISVLKTFTVTPAVPDNSFGVAKLSATGTKDATRFLRGDNTWAAPASGVTPKTIEVDFGTIAKKNATLTFADASLTVGQNIVITQSGEAATGRQADENELEIFEVNGRISAAGVATVNVRPLPGSLLQGKFKLNYMAG